MRCVAFFANMSCNMHRVNEMLWLPAREFFRGSALPKLVLVTAVVVDCVLVEDIVPFAIVLSHIEMGTRLCIGQLVERSESAATESTPQATEGASRSFFVVPFFESSTIVLPSAYPLQRYWRNLPSMDCTTCKASQRPTTRDAQSYPRDLFPGTLRHESKV